MSDEEGRHHRAYICLGINPVVAYVQPNLDCGRDAFFVTSAPSEFAEM